MNDVGLIEGEQPSELTPTGYQTFSREKTTADGWEAGIQKDNVTQILIEYDYKDHVTTTIKTNVSLDQIRHYAQVYFDVGEIPSKDSIDEETGEVTLESEDGNTRFRILPTPNSGDKYAFEVKMDYVDPELPEPIPDADLDREKILRNKFEPFPRLAANISQDVPVILIDSVYARVVENILDS